VEVLSSIASARTSFFATTCGAGNTTLRFGFASFISSRKYA
jgi:hypothetical protein